MSGGQQNSRPRATVGCGGQQYTNIHRRDDALSTPHVEEVKKHERPVRQLAISAIWRVEKHICIVFYTIGGSTTVIYSYSAHGSSTTILYPLFLSGTVAHPRKPRKSPPQTTREPSDKEDCDADNKCSW